MTAGILALLSFNSCDILHSDFDEGNCEASLTCYYAGGLPSASSQQTYEVRKSLSDKEIEDIFYELSGMVAAGFTDAVLKLDFYDWMGNYKHTEVYDFWWETKDSHTGDGYYAWDERMN